MTGEILVWLYWVPTGDRGRFLAHRRMPRSSGGAELHEFWQSDELAEFTAATLDPNARSTTDWQRLLRGLRVQTITLAAAPEPIMLRRLDRTSMHTTAPQVDVASALAEVSIRTSTMGNVVETRGGWIRGSGREPVALGVLPLLRKTLADLQLAPRPADPASVGAVNHPRRFEPSDDLQASLRQAIHLHDVRGVQVGNYNLQVNRFVVRGPDLRLDFEAVLRTGYVKEAMSALMADPANESLRNNLINALRGPTAWQITPEPLVLSARAERPSFFEGLLAFDVYGMQEGDGSTQRNTFVYKVVNSPNAADLLRNDHDLARSLADYLCPPDRGADSPDALSRLINEKLKSLPPEVDRNQGNMLEPPKPGGELRVFRTDGATIGKHNKIRSVQEVNVHASLGLPPPEAPMPMVPSIEPLPPWTPTAGPSKPSPPPPPPPEWITPDQSGPSFGGR